MYYMQSHLTPAIRTPPPRRGVVRRSFGGGHRLFDDRWVYEEPDRSDEAGKRLAVVSGAARAANMSQLLFKARLAVRINNAKDD